MNGSRLRARREALGRSIEELARATRIPAAHIEALEDGRLEELPTGPYAQAYHRTLSLELGLEATESDDAPPPAAEPPRGAPLWVVRALAVTALFALFVVLASWVWERVQPILDAPRVADTTPDQELQLAARRSTHVRVVVDGKTALDQDLTGGDKRTFTARDRVEVEVAQLSALQIRWNGEEIVPQGTQDVPRRLLFVDDAGGADWP